jgi:DNA ligase-1
MVDDDGDEHFAEIMKFIRKGNYTIPNPKYRVFDVLTLNEFTYGTSKYILSTRQARWQTHAPLAGATRKTNMIVPLDQWKLTSRKQLDKLFAEANDKGWEGLIIRKDTTYLGKRSFDLLKVKAMQDAEFVVTRVGTGPFQMVIGGKEVTKQTLTQVYFNYTWKEGNKILTNEIGCGSGFTIAQRNEFFADPSKIIGKTITVKYFEQTVDAKTGLRSLRFPVLKHIYEQDRDE